MAFRKRRHTKAEVASYWAGVRAGKRAYGRSRSRSMKSRSYRRW